MVDEREVVMPVVSGGFDPIHSGHIELICAAAKLGTIPVVVLLNSDEWLARKKGKAFMPFEERASIIANLANVNFVLGFDDSDGSCIRGLEKLKLMYPNNKFIFCNGGDRNANNIPEWQVSDIKFAYGVGGEDKKNSSSAILKNFSGSGKVYRKWGYYTVLWEGKDKGIQTKVKMLHVSPKSELSYQRHQHRTELWQCVQGAGIIRRAGKDLYWTTTSEFFPSEMRIIEEGEWHQLVNPTPYPLVVIEIQFGSKCEEEDIERVEFSE